MNMVVLPGENITKKLNETDKIKIGVGLRKINQEQVICTNGGVLREKQKNRCWVEFRSKRYFPNMDDSVIGVVVDRNVDFYRVDIGAPSMAILPVLAFDGASKRNRPNLTTGALVYARVNGLSRFTDISLTCKATANMKVKDWMTGQAVYGDLDGGFAFKCSIHVAKRLLCKNNATLETLGNAIPFELVVGVNGKVWIHAETAKNIIIVHNAILNSENLTEEECEAMVNHLLRNNTN